MDKDSPKQLAGGKCQIDKDGKASLPKEIIDLLRPLFGSESSIPFSASLLSDGKIQLAPITIDATRYLEEHPEILEGVARAYDDIREGRFVPKEEIDKLLKR